MFTADKLNWTKLTCTKMTLLHDALLVTRVSDTKLIGCRSAVRLLQFANCSVQFSSVRLLRTRLYACLVYGLNFCWKIAYAMIMITYAVYRRCSTYRTSEECSAFGSASLCWRLLKCSSLSLISSWLECGICSTSSVMLSENSSLEWSPDYGNKKALIS